VDQKVPLTIQRPTLGPVNNTQFSWIQELSRRYLGKEKKADGALGKGSGKLRENSKTGRDPE